MNKGTFIDLNAGRDNLNFTATSLDYSIKWLHIFNGSVEFSMKANFGMSPWAVANYNGGITKDDYNLFLFGGKAKFFLELRPKKEEGDRKNGQDLKLALCFYDSYNYTGTPGPRANTFFFFTRLAWSFPLTGNLSLYLADSFSYLNCYLTENLGPDFTDIGRWFNSAQAGVKFSFY